MTLDRDRFRGAAERSGLFTADYAEDVLVRLAHHSSAIEGNTLSLSDTITLLIDEVTPSGKSVREAYEIQNHREALLLVIEAVASDAALDDRLVRGMHRALLDHLLPDRGEYKSSSNLVAGASFVPTAPEHVAEAMRQWADQADWQTRHLDGAALLEAIAASHINFERIHPFADGNGRTGRLIAVFQLVKRFGVPAVITADQRSEYLGLLDAQDARGLATLLARQLALETDRVQRP